MSAKTSRSRNKQENVFVQLVVSIFVRIVTLLIFMQTNEEQVGLRKHKNLNK